MATPKRIRQTARVLLKVSTENGAVTEERVTGVLVWIEKNEPTQGLAILREYQRLVQTEVNKFHARIEHSGALSADAASRIAASLSARYNRRVTATTQENPSLIAGLRVSIGDDVFESSIAGQLETLSIAD